MIFKKSVVLNTDIHSLFAFHLDTNNAIKISPPFPFLDLVHISEIPLRQNSTLTMQLNFVLFKIDWELTISQMEPLRVITDSQIKGPVYKWQHHHRFEERDGSVCMVDEVEFRSFKNKWLALIIDPVVYLTLYGLFVFRHSVMKKLFRRH